MGKELVWLNPDKMEWLWVFCLPRRTKWFFIFATHLWLWMGGNLGVFLVSQSLLKKQPWLVGPLQIHLESTESWWEVKNIPISGQAVLAHSLGHFMSGLLQWALHWLSLKVTWKCQLVQNAAVHSVVEAPSFAHERLLLRKLQFLCRWNSRCWLLSLKPYIAQGQAICGTTFP